MLTIDHIVLTVEDINKTTSLYTDILLMDLLLMDLNEFTPIKALKPKFVRQFCNQKIVFTKRNFLSNHTRKIQLVGVSIFAF